MYLQKKWCTPAYHTLADALLVPRQLLPHTSQLSTAVKLYLTWCHMVRSVLLASCCQQSWFCPSHNSLCLLSLPHWQDSTRSWNVLGSAQHCSAILVCYQHCFSAKFKTHQISHMKSKKSTLSRLKSGHMYFHL